MDATGHRSNARERPNGRPVSANTATRALSLPPGSQPVGTWGWDCFGPAAWGRGMPSQSLVAPDAASLEFELAHAILDSNRSCLLRLSSQNLSQLALAWCLANPIVTSVIIGAQTWDQHAEKLGVSEWSGTLRMSGPWMRWSRRERTRRRGFKTRLVPYWGALPWTEEPGRAPLRDILTIPPGGLCTARCHKRACRSQGRRDRRV